MSYRWPIFVVVTALLVALVVLAVLDAGEAETSPPRATGLRSAGAPFGFDALRGAPWVAALLPPDCPPPCSAALDGVEALRRRLPGAARLIVVGAEGTPGAVTGDRAALAALAEELGGASAGALLFVVFDGSGHPRSVQPVDLADAASRERGSAASVREFALLVGLGSRPLLHARLNAASAVILVVGFVLIRRRLYRWHAAAMVLAALTTLTFLVSYLYYHAHAGSMPFRGQGWSRPLYFGVLLSHTVLAAFVAPLAASLFYFAARRRFERHRRIARWTLPLWLYVSVTGVLIYLMLYRWFPA